VIFSFYFFPTYFPHFQNKIKIGKCGRKYVGRSIRKKSGKSLESSEDYLAEGIKDGQIMLDSQDFPFPFLFFQIFPTIR